VRTLTTRIVLLAVVVALASAAVTTLALARSSAETRREQGAAQLQQDAQTLASLADGGRPAAVRAQRLRLRARGVDSVVVQAGASRNVARPFKAADVAAARSGPLLDGSRVVAGLSWQVAGTSSSGNVALVAQPVDQAARISPEQRRRLLFSLGLGLLGGGLAGLLLALSVTRPLARVAVAARRLSAGERGVRVPASGPAEVADVAAALDSLDDALAASEGRQRAFLLAVSHELRTPLTAVSGYAEALADGTMTDVPAAAQVIRDEAARLHRRVEDLLALARMEADDFRLEVAPVEVGSLLRAAAAACGPRAERVGVPVSVVVPPSGPVVLADGERLRQAVDALVDNALRVLPAGAPLVLAARTEGAEVRIEVRDGGPGLTPADQAVAFDRGRLTERYRGSRPVGTGLGLALVGELARRLGGRAEASTAPEGGASFAVVLPGPADAVTAPWPPRAPR
jgi:two-component system sensor histidine kinase BaeS